MCVCTLCTAQSASPEINHSMSVKWPVKFKPAPSYPIIGKFDEKLDFEKARKPVRMYMKEEDILNETDVNIAPTSEARKRKRRP